MSRHRPQQTTQTLQLLLHETEGSQAHTRKSWFTSRLYRIMTSAKEVLVGACLSVCDQRNLKSHGRIVMKFSGNVCPGTRKKLFDFFYHSGDRACHSVLCPLDVTVGQ